MTRLTYTGVRNLSGRLHGGTEDQHLPDTHLMLIEGVDEGYEASSLGLLVQSQKGNVAYEDCIKQSGYLQIVNSTQRLQKNRIPVSFFAKRYLNHYANQSKQSPET